MTFATGTLVKARGREWVVLPESEDDFLVVRPLGGTTQETAGIHLALEPVEQASFTPPTKEDLGDFVSCRLLRDAVRLGFRSSAGPFRSFGRLAVQPRPYQLVPLLMALKLDPVRLLIADDVGIGKTVEACMVAREMLDRGEIQRMCVLCPPHLAEQWQKELLTKFNIAAELVLTGTARRLERNLRGGQSIFDANPFVVVSMDFIKSDRRRHDFLRTCPEFVIVDEAHTCAADVEGRSQAHQRHLVLKKLTEDEDRHVVLVTATPHSGKEGAFRSLLGLLKDEFESLPQDLAGETNAANRRKLAAHLVQRRRADLRHFLQRDTPFPERKNLEQHYKLGSDYRALFEKILAYAQETVLDATGGALQQRVRWWSALSLLRALASSPAAAEATLRARSRTVEAADPETADEIGRKSVLDAVEDSGEETSDEAPGADTEVSDEENANRRRLLAFAREARKLRGDDDRKLVEVVKHLKDLLNDGFKPILFCRFIETAEYVAEELRARLGSKVEVTCVTSRLAPEERSARIELIDGDKAASVLVCTDCLSEGINLQDKFDAVVHYDLSWNPTRHEQREGRVDRYGQRSPEVRVLTYYGTDNRIDGIVLDILLRKHEKIRNALGISVPIPVNSEQIVNAIFEGLLLRKQAGAGGRAEQMQLSFMETQKADVHKQWEDAAEREKRSRTVYAQESIKFQDVAAELEAAERAVGSPQDLARFFHDALHLSGAVVKDGETLQANLAGLKPGLRDALGEMSALNLAFNPVNRRGAQVLHRTHPMVESFASYILNSALDREVDGIARRAGVVRSKAVNTRTVLLLLRLRFHIVTKVRNAERSLLAEDSLLVGFTGEPASPTWLSDAESEAMLALKPDSAVTADVARQQLDAISSRLNNLAAELDRITRDRGQQLLEAHRRVREASKHIGQYRIEQNQPDILGAYVFLPVVKV